MPDPLRRAITATQGTEYKTDLLLQAIGNFASKLAIRSRRDLDRDPTGVYRSSLSDLHTNVGVHRVVSPYSEVILLFELLRSICAAVLDASMRTTTEVKAMGTYGACTSLHTVAGDVRASEARTHKHTHTRNKRTLIPSACCTALPTLEFTSDKPDDLPLAVMAMLNELRNKTFPKDFRPLIGQLIVATTRSSALLALYKVCTFNQVGRHCGVHGSGHLARFHVCPAADELDRDRRSTRLRCA